MISSIRHVDSAQLYQETKLFYFLLREKLRKGYWEEACLTERNPCFGSWIMMENGAITVEGEEEDMIINTQVDKVDGKKLTERGKQIAKRWSCWNVYDVRDGNFVCCIRCAVGSGINVTKMSCTQCKLGSQRKCRHETSCGKLLSESGHVNMNDNGELQELGPGNEERDLTVGTKSLSNSEYGDTCSDGEADQKGESSNRTVEVITETDSIGICSMERIGSKKKCIYESKSFFTSKKFRPLYMCPAETKITEQLTDWIETWDRNNGGIRFVDPDGSLCGGTVMNGEGEETECSSEKDEKSRLLPRKVTLFTLNHGLINIVIVDWVCMNCTFENRYCGEVHGLYAAAKHRCFTVELLYFWLHESIARGMSFRSIFDLTSNLHDTGSYRRKNST